MAIDPSHLSSATGELQDKFITLLNSLSMVRALSNLEIHSRDAASLLKEALKPLMQYQGMERCSAFLLKGGVLKCVAGLDSLQLFEMRKSGSHKPLPKRPRGFRLGEGLMGLAAENGEIQQCGDCEKDPRVTLTDEAGMPVTGSLICVPIINGGTTLGVINIYHPEKHYFEEWMNHTMLVYSSILGHMLASHNVVQRLERRVEERTGQLEATLAEAERLKRRYKELATIDELTGLHNRRYFFKETESVLSRALRYHDEFCLLLIDLDYFKQVNDRYGHQIGDQVLVGLAEALWRHIREGDILARFGGEEFVLALPQIPIEGTIKLASRISRYVSSLRWRVPGGNLRITLSTGITCLGPQVSREAKTILDEMVGQADQALYYAKHHGRNQTHSYTALARTGKLESLHQ